MDENCPWLETYIHIEKIKIRDVASNIVLRIKTAILLTLRASSFVRFLKKNYTMIKNYNIEDVASPDASECPGKTCKADHNRECSPVDKILPLNSLTLGYETDEQ